MAGDRARPLHSHPGHPGDQRTLIEKAHFQVRKVNNDCGGNRAILPYASAGANYDRHSEQCEHIPEEPYLQRAPGSPRYY